MSTLMYGSECWTISSEMEKKLEAMEMWCFRRTQRLSWTEKVANEEVLKRVRTWVYNVLRVWVCAAHMDGFF